MTQEEIYANLCYYDTRCTDGYSECLSHEEMKEEGLGEKPKENCSCDNCFYGRTKLAMYILELKK